MDHARPRYRHLFDIVSPDEAVVPMAVAEILIELVDAVFGQVIAPCMTGRVGRLDHRAVRQQQGDAALQPQGKTEIAPARHDDGAPAGRGCGQDRGVDRGAVDRPPVAARAMIAHVELARGMGGERQAGEAAGDQAQRDVAASHRHHAQLPAGR